GAGERPEPPGEGAARGRRRRGRAAAHRARARADRREPAARGGPPGHQSQHAAEEADGARDPHPTRQQVTLPSRLYVVVDPLDTGRDPVALARAVLAGGARLVQLRSKTVATGELLRQAA